MRHVLCRPCGLRATGERLPVNMTRITPANEDGPAEFERFIWGTARHPKPSQREIRVNGERIPLSPGAFECDACGAPILPGAETCCHSAIDAGRRVAPWETEYIDTLETGEVPR